ncbi:kynureninase [Altererythrobacter sp. MF3-039]|uniref:kynureninase n=1 Tax=Altererythrobacter sp. MF3-039 TaxID=3252901 RepID=UPI00390C4CB9
MVGHVTREDVLAMDASDPLSACRERFHIPDGLIYLDGNSLGPLPKRTVKHLQMVVTDHWGESLIGSWNDHDWMTLPARIGAEIALLLGAGADEVIACDSTSINIYKLVHAALAARADRSTLLVEAAGFPTDRYLVESVCEQAGGQSVRTTERSKIIDRMDESTALIVLTHVDYRTGHMLDMTEVNAAARSVGALVLWDLSHSAGAVPLDLGDCGADLAVGCGYKYLNGGPGAPAFLYVRKELQNSLQTPLPGWFGHAQPFAFEQNYVPAAGIDRFLCGTPPILAMTALESGVETFQCVELPALFAKSRALCELYIGLMEQRCSKFGFALASPREAWQRGSQVSFAHEHSYAICQALIERGVVGDFRAPDILRMGFAPLYTRYIDVWDAVETLHDVMQTTLWQEERFQTRKAVT